MLNKKGISGGCSPLAANTSIFWSLSMSCELASMIPDACSEGKLSCNTCHTSLCSISFGDSSMVIRAEGSSSSLVVFREREMFLWLSTFWDTSCMALLCLDKGSSFRFVFLLGVSAFGIAVVAPEKLFSECQSVSVFNSIDDEQQVSFLRSPIHCSKRITLLICGIAIAFLTP